MKMSPIHGTGLFGYDIPSQENGMAIFNTKYKWIMKYEGELLSANELRLRYGENTAPYAVDYVNEQKIDSACLRGAAAAANTLILTQAQLDKLGKSPSNAQLRRITVRTEMMNKKHKDYQKHKDMKFNCILTHTDDGVWLEAIADIKHDDELICYYGRDYKIEPDIDYKNHYSR